MGAPLFASGFVTEVAKVLAFLILVLIQALGLALGLHNHCSLVRAPQVLDTIILLPKCQCHAGLQPLNQVRQQLQF